MRANKDIWNKWSLFNFMISPDVTCLCFAISGVESRPSPSWLASWHLGVRWTRRGLLPHHQTFPLHRDAELQPCGTTSHQLHVGFPYDIKPNSVFFYLNTEVKSFLVSRSCSHRFNAFHAETKRPLHRECGFIRMQPGTNRVAFIIAQNSGSDVTDWTKPLLSVFVQCCGLWWGSCSNCTGKSTTHSN